MKLTMLGTSAACPSSEEPCSGFLLQNNAVNILFDCGTGVLVNLQKYVDLRDIDAIFISHMHSDHFFDLIPYRYALHFGLDYDITRGKIKLFLPPGGSSILDHTVSTFAETTSFFGDVFHVLEYSPDDPVEVKNLIVRFYEVQHFISTYGAVISCENRKIAYSSDTGPCDALYEIASQADLFICHAGACLSNGKISEWGHMPPKKAGEIARMSGAKRLLLSHLWPNCNKELAITQAKQTFGGSVEIAKSCVTLAL